MKALYITYDGLSDPLGQSQILPYIKGLSSPHLQWTILSFEKKERTDPIIKKTEEDLTQQSIQWIKIPYHHKFNILSKIYDLMYGFITLLWNHERYDIIHVRSYIAAPLGLITRKRHPSKFIFDMRGFWPEERVEGGLWKKNGWKYRLFKVIEKKLIKESESLIVLTKKAKTILQEKSKYPSSKKIVVIPTCVDTTKFSPKTSIKIPLSLCYSGSLGTWYCLDEMLLFFRHVKKQYNSATFNLFINWTSLQKISPTTKSYLNTLPDVKLESYSYDDLPHYLSPMSIGIFFIKPSFSKQASCPTKLGEFLAMGIPLIMNKGIGDCDEWIEKEKLGILVDNFTIASYQKTLEKLPSLLEDREMSNRCITFANKHLSLSKGLVEYKKILFS